MKHLAIDIGAESGRAIVGSIEDGCLKIEEIYRFPNRPVSTREGLQWDIETLLNNVRKSISLAPRDTASVGIDTWAVDYVLFKEGDEPSSFCYRDTRTSKILDRELPLSKKDIYLETGIQLMPLNSLFQLSTESKGRLQAGRTFLAIPDYLNFELTGRKRHQCEFTNATTTQLLDARTSQWSERILDAFELPKQLFPPIISPGTALGPCMDSDIQVIAVASHDTASAVAGTPLSGSQEAWLSSGTWSILGLEMPTPIISESTYEANFTNEGGVGSTYRFSKNVAGLWLLQQCREAWGEESSYDELMRSAEACPEPDELIDPDDPIYFEPGEMIAKINSKLRLHLDDRGQIVRLILQSLAHRYAQVLSKAEQLSDIHVQAIRIVGGGSKNRLLNQLTANACRKRVVAGPTEATAIGNLIVQMIAMGRLDSISQGRALIANSFPLVTFEPSS